VAVQQGDPPGRDYLTSTGERLRRHVRVHGTRALLGGVTASGVLAGFVSAAGMQWSLLTYIGLAAAFSLLILLASSLPGWRARRMLLGRGTAAHAAGRPHQLELVAVAPSAPLRQIAAARCDDPVYGAGLRVMLTPSRPIVVIASNRRDVSREHELPLPLFTDGRRRRTRVEVDPRQFGIPMSPYTFERELPEGVQDTDHTLAIKDLVFVPELAAALTEGAATQETLLEAPVMWPEHCVDPAQLAQRDVVVVGGPDTNFWHGALFEPVARSFAAPASSVPLALDLRDASGILPAYGSRSISVVLADTSAVLRHTREERTELDERLYPTYGMILACRNPFAAAVGRSHWCTFVAGTRSLGTSGAVLALVMMLRAMRRDPSLNFFSEVPTDSPKVRARVSAVLCRTVGVEQAVLRRDGRLTAREVRRLAPEGLDPRYSDSYIPVEVEYLGYADQTPRWTRLGRLAGA
jgi:hypothetical protein